MVEHHSGSEHKNEPFNAQREEAGVLKLGVDRPDQHRARKKACDDRAGDEQNDRTNGMREVREHEERNLRLSRIGGVEGRDTDEEAEDNAGPESSPRNECRGAMRRSPIAYVAALVAGDTLVKLHGSENAAEKRRESGSD